MTAATAGAPRLLAIMGSGETAPTMVKVHRDLLARLGPPPVPAVVLDTPFGFQENADELVARTIAYFRESVGAELAVASFRSAAAADALDVERMLTTLRQARYLFAGPGSPSYALRQWRESPVPEVLVSTLRAGGCVSFASAAALTLGRFTVPVYEIYKVGEEPRWLEGLDLMAAAGLDVAVIPHYDNAEGGTHDTRFCYLGAGRLARLEAELPDETFVLGVDEHTALVLDLDAGSAEVLGRGGVTVRKDGRSHVLPAGTTTGIAELRALAAAPDGAGPAPRQAAEDAAATAPTGASPLLTTVAEFEDAFTAALAAGDSGAAARAMLALEDELVAWSRDSLQSDEADRGRAVLRSMIVRLGDVAATGTRDPAELVGPFVDTLIEARDEARRQRRWADADRLRDRLVGLGVEVSDTEKETRWRLLS